MRVVVALLLLAACTREAPRAARAVAPADIVLDGLAFERWESDQRVIHVEARTATASRTDLRIKLRSVRVTWAGTGSAVQVRSGEALVDLRAGETIFTGGVDVETAARMTVHAERARHDWRRSTFNTSGPMVIRVHER